MERINLLQNQLKAVLQESPKVTLRGYRQKGTIDKDDLQSVYWGKLNTYQQQMWQFMDSNPIFKQADLQDMTREEVRDISFKQFSALAKQFPLTIERLRDGITLFTFGNAVSSFDMGVSAKFGVHVSLYCVAVDSIGTSKHLRFLEDAVKGKDIGCFALTELRHGSNTKQMQVRADYDHSSREFVINTPEMADMKVWIGGSAHMATMCVVWAQLYIDGKSQGLHAFIVPIRNRDTYEVLPGIIIGDMGAKTGLEPVDNGFLIFQDCRIPYDNLLDRFSHINEKGNFKSPIKNPDKRFAFVLGTLTGGRMLMTSFASCHLMNALTITTRFLHSKKIACQHKDPQPERALIEYPINQYRLIPYFAVAMGISFGNRIIAEKWGSDKENLFKEGNHELAEIHAISSAFKAWASWKSHDGIQESRELCGGFGISSYSRLGQLRSENDIHKTWEGDNNVLLQQTGKFILDGLKALSKGKEVPHKSLSFLVAGFDPSEYKTTDGESEFAKSGHNLLKALETRANYLIGETGKELFNVMNVAENPLEAWNMIQFPYVRRASLAFLEVYIYNSFVEGKKRSSKTANKELIKNMQQILALWILEKDTALFEIGYMNQADMLWLRDSLYAMFDKVRDELVAVVDALGPPDGVLNSVIGSQDGDLYNRFVGKIFSQKKVFERPSYWKDIIQIHQEPNSKTK